MTHDPRFERPDWMDRGNCLGLDPDLFFGERADAGNYREARAVCRGCAVREDCLEYAVANREKFGLWGGMSPKERQRLGRKRRMSA